VMDKAIEQLDIIVVANVFEIGVVLHVELTNSIKHSYLSIRVHELTYQENVVGHPKSAGDDKR